MKKNYRDLNESEEMELLAKELDPREMYVFGFLKGFNRRQLREWGKKGLIDFAVQ